MKILIVYEIFNREFDNALLLKFALEHNGNVVRIIPKNDLIYLKKDLEPEVVFVPNCYSDDDFNYYYYCINNPHCVFINLQYEQVLSNSSSNLSFHIPSGKARDIYHLCWGDQFFDLLKKNGIKKVFKSGALQLDFLRKEFLNYWESKEFIRKKYEIHSDKIILFISSFSYADNENVLYYITNQLGKQYATEFSKLSSLSRTSLLEWFSEALQKSDVCIVYRKHPMELLNSELINMEKELKGKFRIIDDYNIKQWIQVSDKIYTWYSTSAVECYVAQKPFGILRPVTIPKKYEVTIFNDADFITSLEVFVKEIDNLEVHFPISYDVIRKSYIVDDTPAFYKILQLVNNCFDDNNYNNVDETRYFKERIHYMRKHNFRCKEILKKMYLFLYNRGIFKVKNKKLRKRYAFDVWENRKNVKFEHGDMHKLKNIINDYFVSEENLKIKG